MSADSPIDRVNRIIMIAGVSDPALWMSWKSYLLIFYSLFTPPTQTRQDSFVSSAPAVWTQLKTRQDTFVSSMSAVWTQLETRQDSFVSSANSWRQDKTVLSRPCRRCEHSWRQDSFVSSANSWRQDKTVLSRPRRRCEHSWRQDKTLLSRPCRQCEQAVCAALLLVLKLVTCYSCGWWLTCWVWLHVCSHLLSSACSISNSCQTPSLTTRHVSDSCLHLNRLFHSTVLFSCHSISALSSVCLIQEHWETCLIKDKPHESCWIYTGWAKKTGLFFDSL